MSLVGQVAVAVAVVLVDLGRSWVKRQIALGEAEIRRLEAERAQTVREDEQRHAEWLRQTNGRGF